MNNYLFSCKRKQIPVNVPNKIFNKIVIALYSVKCQFTIDMKQSE